MSEKQVTGMFKVGLDEQGHIAFKFEKSLKQLVMEPDEALSVAQKIIELYLFNADQN